MKQTDSSATSPAAPRFATAVRLVATLSAAYGLSQFLRASVGVIAPELSAELNLGPGDLGGLAGAFFFVFALAQIPVGMALDRWGPRRVLLSLAVFTVAGCLLFATADSVTGLVAGRMLMGFGCAAMLMGPYVIYGREFPARRFAQLSSIQMGVGYAGAVLATAPLALATEVWGWRSVFMGAAGAAVFFVLLTGAVVTRDTGKAPRRARHSVADDLAGVVTVIKLPSLRPIIPLNMVTYGAVASILTLWGGPYLADVHGLAPVARGNVLLAMWITAIAGLLAFGMIEGRLDRTRGLVILGAGANAAALLGLALWPSGSLGLCVGLLCAVAFLNGVTIAIAAQIRRALPHHLMGRGLTFMNMGMMMGVALLQVLLGWIADQGVGDQAVADSVLSATVYGRLFATLGVLLAVSVAWFVWRDPGKDVAPPL